MPTLRQRGDGGYYIVANLPGIGLCTYQVTSAGLTWLRAQGLLSDGTYLSPADLNSLRSQEGVTTRGEHPPTPVDPQLVALESWGRSGRFEDLDRALRQGDLGDSVLLTCFSSPFLLWIEDLVRPASLSGLLRLSWPDFSQRARPRLHRLNSELHQELVLRFELIVLWRLAQIVGRVAEYVDADEACPSEWARDYPLLARLYLLLRRVTSESKAPEPSSRERGQEPEHVPVEPFLWWDVDGQQVIAVFPGCPLEEGTSVSWEVSGTSPPPLHATIAADGRRVLETHTEPLDPVQSYQITVRFSHPHRAPLHGQWVWELPTNLRPCVLFNPEGRLIDCRSLEDPLPAGEGYLVLAPATHALHLDKIAGVEVEEKIPIQPIGWEGWRGHRVRLQPGASIGPYLVSSEEADVSWALEAPGQYPVQFDTVSPVWLGGCPSITVSASQLFADAVIQVETSCGHFQLREGEAFHAPREPGKATLDLVALLSDRFGAITLRARLPRSPLTVLPALRFIRLQPSQFEYVPHPEFSEHASALRVTGAAILEAGPGTVTDREGAGWLVRSSSPANSPGVVVLFPEERVELSIRLPVTRACHQTSERQRLEWNIPPLPLRLSEVKLDDLLRVQFQRPPLLSQGQLMCRLVGGNDICCGKVARGSSEYQIPLTRWRDAFGPSAAGRVQVRLEDRWLDLADLKATAGPPEKTARRSRPLLPIKDLLTAVLDGNANDTRRASCACLTAASKTDTLSREEQLRVAAASGFLHLGCLPELAQALRPLEKRADLYEVSLLLATSRLRSGEGAQAVEEVREWARRLNVECPQRWRLLAECEYHYALCPDPAPATWETCIRTVDQAPWPTTEILAGQSLALLDWLDAVLLRGLAQLILFQEVIIPGNVPHGGPFRWLDAIAQATQTLRAPLGRVEVSDFRDLEEAKPAILRSEEANLVRLILAQGRGEADKAARLLAQLDASGSTLLYLPARQLLQGRQARLESRLSEARGIYDGILAGVRAGVSLVPKPVLLGEYPAKGLKEDTDES